MKNLKLILILILAIALRFYNINSYPALNPDEAALGYNAYSLILTGKDEHGISWPIHFKSFGDYKPGGYVYLAIPSVKLFGLTPFATRLPNLIFSILGIYYTYLLIHLITHNKALALLSALVLTISPWHIHFSRGAWEACTALSFIIIGTYYFFKDKKILFILFYVLSLYTYHSARLVAPLLALSLIITNYKLLITNYKKWIMPIIFGILICMPVALSFFSSGGTARIGGVGLTADKGPLNRSEELLNQHGNVLLFNRVIHNKRILYLLSWGEKYASHFNLNYLFVEGDAVPRSKIPEMGLLYLVELPLLIYGIYKSRELAHQRTSNLFLIWLFIAPIASSITFQAPSALRSLPMVIPLSYFIAFGIYKLRKYKYLFIVFYILFLSYYLDAYFIHYQKRYPFAWNYGFSKVVPYVNSVKDKYQNIYFTNKYDQPYILYLFFSKYPPLDIQKQIKLTPPDKFGFSTVEKIDNITFSIPSKIPDNSLVIDDKMFLP